MRIHRSLNYDFGKRTRIPPFTRGRHHLRLPYGSLDTALNCRRSTPHSRPPFARLFFHSPLLHSDISSELFLAFLEAPRSRHGNLRVRVMQPFRDL